MKARAFKQSIGFAVISNPYVHKNGMNTLFLRVIIDRKKMEFNLGKQWPKEKFDAMKQIALPRFPNDPEVDALNMIIQDARSKANRIEMRYFADGNKLTLELFRREFEFFEHRENFLFYWENKMKQLYDDLILAEDTFRQHKTQLQRLKDFLNSEYLSVGDINIDLIRRYNAWLRKVRKLEHNSACTAHKAFRTYIYHAIDDKYRIENPYKRFPVRFREGEREALEHDEIEALKDLIGDARLNDIGQEVLLKFLFSCYTGLRISDNKTVDRAMIRDWKMRISLKKGLGYGKKVNMLLPDFAKEIIEGRRGLVFNKLADQTCNRWLKDIFKIAGINKKASFHVSRDTFATQFIIRGGDIHTLQGLMGHSDIRTTNIYIKMAENRADEQMMNFND